jgi:hypothetical protein
MRAVHARGTGSMRYRVPRVPEFLHWRATVVNDGTNAFLITPVSPPIRRKRLI